MPFAFVRFRKRKLPGTIVLVAAFCFLNSCTELKRSEPNPYLAETQPPPVQEFRWTNGGMPESLDPARATAAPETDVIRAIYEGLTDLDPKTLEARPGVAEKWSTSDEGRTWTFYLRDDAKWSNGKAVTASDFVRSWQRVYDMGEASAHPTLFRNFAITSEKKTETIPATPPDFVEQSYPNDNVVAEEPTPSPSPKLSAIPVQRTRMAVTAPDDRTLVVVLETADASFPELVSHPIFRPVLSENIAKEKLDPKVVTNGAFRIMEIGDNTISLERSKTYWDQENIKLDKVSFVATEKPDEALEAYRTGTVDAVTNTELSPLAQKVFSPYGDFRKTAFAALNFYEINYRKAPYNDRRVREALAISIEREQLMSGEYEATAQPAYSFLPFGKRGQTRLVQDKERAKDLLEQAGFPDGNGFPVVRLTVNRNETQIRIARAVAKMWKDNINVETEIVVRENSEINEIRAREDFDVLRRGVVLPVPDEFACISAILSDNKTNSEAQVFEPTSESMTNSNTSPRPPSSPNASNSNSASNQAPVQIQSISETEALYQLRAIPLYFPTSFALVKPFVEGFETNSLDIVDLNNISINSEWRPAQK